MGPPETNRNIRILDLPLRKIKIPRPDLTSCPPAKLGFIARSWLEFAADAVDPPDAFRLLGYEPICIPRVSAALALGFSHPSQAPPDLLPPPCGGCPQERFHAATYEVWDLLYGGAAGGSKTRGLLMEGIRAAYRHPGLAVLAIRESYPQLKESFIAELSRIDYASKLGATYHKGDHDLNFTNRSVIRFRFCDGLEDARLRLGSEIQLLLVDEATQQDPAAIDFLATRIRTSRPDVPALGLRLGSNPGGLGHGHCKKRYVTATLNGSTTYEDVVDGKPTSHFVGFIRAKYTDNPYLQDYESTLDAIKDPLLRAAYRDGSWDIVPDQMFEEWRAERHTLPSFVLPQTWERLCALDWGFAAPHCVLWGAIDQDSRVWIYRESYDTKITEDVLADRILDWEEAAQAMGLDGPCPEPYPRRYADPSIWIKNGQADPIATTFELHGVPFSPAQNDRISGWQRVHTFLAEAPACELHRASPYNWATCPLLHVFLDQCPNLVRTLPDLPRDRRNIEDVNTRAEDHAADALRYLLMEARLPSGAFHHSSDPAASSDMQDLGLFAVRTADLRSPATPDLRSVKRGGSEQTRRSPFWVP